MSDDVVDGKLILIKIDDFNRVCRCCLSQSPDITSIFELVYEKDPFVDILFKLFGTQVNLDDQLPANICERCIREIIHFYNFKKIYENSEATLLSVITTNSIEPTDKHENFKDHIEKIETPEKLEDFEEHTELDNTEYSIKLESIDESYNQLEENGSITLPERGLDRIEFNIDEESGKENEAVSNENAKDYFCEICNKKFDNSAFWLHRRKIHRKRYSCEICSKSFLKLVTLKVHKRIHVENDKEETNEPKQDPKTYTCSCNQIFTSRTEFIKHKKQKNHVNSKTAACKICNKVISRRHMAVHLRVTHSDEKPYGCGTCGINFKAKINLVRHNKRHAREDDRDETNKPKQNRKTYICSCNQTFTSQTVFIKHKKEENHENPKTLSCKICNKMISRGCLAVHMRVTHSDEKPYNCGTCGISFKMKHHFIRHQMRHTGEQPHVCDFCGKGFIQKNGLIEHRRRHTGEKPYLCAHCGKRFNKKHYYRVHLLTKHENPASSSVTAEKTMENCYKCEFCDKMYTSKMSLKVHMDTHGEKKFLCTHCGKRFFQQSGLKSHILVHTGEKKFFCELCGKSFARFPTFQNHQYIHSGLKPYTCQVCQKSFRVSSHLIRHSRTHTGEKPYACKFCGKTFAEGQNRTVHERSHTGERPYVCDVCSKGFYHSSAMTKHRRGHFKKTDVGLNVGDVTE